MLQLTEVTSVDYQNVKALAGNGMVPNWMGFMWVMSNRLNVPAASQLDCLAFTRAAIGLTNQRVAQHAARAWLLVSGRPLELPPAEG